MLSKISETTQQAVILFLWTILIILGLVLVIFNIPEKENLLKSVVNNKGFDVEIVINSIPNFCSENLDENIILVVSTQFVTRGDFKYRKAVRETWGKKIKHKRFLFENVFLLGKANDSNEDSKIEEKLIIENLKYGDLIIGNFIDSYKNLTYKRLLGSKWIIEHCPNAQFIIKIDDEMYPDIYRIIDLIDEHAPRSKHTQFLAHLGCHVFERNYPSRNSSDKMYVSVQEYSREFFPDFCFGPASISTRAALIAEYSVKDQVPFFWAEDVFFTGLLREYYELVNNVPINLIIIPLSHYYHYPQFRDRLLWWCESEVTRYIYPGKFEGIFIEMVRGKEMISDLYCLHKKTLEVKRQFELYNKLTLL